MHRIIYLSSAPVLLAPDEIAEILAVSRRNNAAAGITGLLLYHDGNILQVLEGEEPALSACFARICRDSRHRQVIVLKRSPVEARAFPQWQMGYARLQDLFGSEEDAVLSLHDIAARGLGAGGDPMVERLVSSFLGGFRDLSQSAGLGRVG